MSKRKGRTTIIRQETDGGRSPNLYVGEISAEIRVFAPPHTPAESVVDVLTKAYQQALTDARRDFQ